MSIQSNGMIKYQSALMMTADLGAISIDLRAVAVDVPASTTAPSTRRRVLMMRPRRHLASVVAMSEAAVAAALLVVLALSAMAGCTASSPPPSGPRASSPAGQPAEGAGAAVAGATAAESKVAFDRAAERVIAATADPTTDTFVEELERAGFDRSHTQVSSNETTQGKPVDAQFWSVEFPDGYLVGQYRNVPPEPERQSAIVPYSSMTAPPTANGCLVGGALAGGR
jgi:hypothetical protein